MIGGFVKMPLRIALARGIIWAVTRIASMIAGGGSLCRLARNLRCHQSAHHETIPMARQLSIKKEDWTMQALRFTVMKERNIALDSLLANCRTCVLVRVHSWKPVIRMGCYPPIWETILPSRKRTNLLPGWLTHEVVSRITGFLVNPRGGPN